MIVPGPCPSALCIPAQPQPWVPCPHAAVAGVLLAQRIAAGIVGAASPRYFQLQAPSLHREQPECPSGEKVENRMQKPASTHSHPGRGLLAAVPTRSYLLVTTLLSPIVTGCANERHRPSPASLGPARAAPQNPEGSAPQACSRGAEPDPLSPSPHSPARRHEAW